MARKQFAYRRKGPARRRPRRLGGKKTVLKGFTAQQSKTLLAAINRSDETKYYATDLTIGMPIDPAIHSPVQLGTNTGDMFPLVPAIVAGTGESQRVGRSVKPVKCRVDVSLAFKQSNIGEEAPADQSWANQVYVVMYILRSKVHKNWNDFALSNQWMRLLDNGDSTSTSFGYQPGGTAVWAADTRDLMKPIETSEFTLLRKRVVKLTKNSGTIDNGPTPNAPNLPSTSYRGSFSYKLPELKYDGQNQTAGGYPTNSNVFIAFGFCYADNLGTYNYAGGQITAVAPIVSVSARNHVWYKDS